MNASEHQKGSDFHHNINCSMRCSYMHIPELQIFQKSKIQTTKPLHLTVSVISHCDVHHGEVVNK